MNFIINHELFKESVWKTHCTTTHNKLSFKSIKNSDFAEKTKKGRLLECQSDRYGD